eukprot:5348630-Heterocapsa_arctica.AAC.1
MQMLRSSVNHALTCLGSGSVALGASRIPSNQSRIRTCVRLRTASLSKALPCASNLCLSFKSKRE